jgi:hypothetical protein
MSEPNRMYPGRSMSPVPISEEFDTEDSTDRYETEDTGRFDMPVYSFVVEYLQGLSLRSTWKVSPLQKGVMLYLYKGDEQERMFIESNIAFLNLEETLVNWDKEDDDASLADCGMERLSETILVEVEDGQ